MTRRHRLRLAAAVLTLPVLTSACAPPNPTEGSADGRTYVVAPDGAESAGGSSPGDATTLQAALDRVRPGDTIRLEAGTHRVSRPLKTRTSGEKDRPITVEGSESGLDVAGRNTTVLLGGGHVIEINHDHYVLQGFTINGQPDLELDDIPTGASDLVEFKNANQSRVVDGQLIYVGAKARGVSGTVIRDMFLTGAGGECVRMRSFAADNLVTKSRIRHCGFKKDNDNAYPYHNGEGVYIGTSPKSTDQPYAGSDSSTRNIVQDNVIETYSAECVNIKENATENVVDANRCRFSLGSADDNESAIEVRGKDNDVTDNVIEDSAGLGIKVWADETRFGGGNVVAGNRFDDIGGAVITVKRQPSLPTVCENVYLDGMPMTAGLGDIDISEPC